MRVKYEVTIEFAYKETEFAYGDRICKRRYGSILVIDTVFLAMVSGLVLQKRNRGFQESLVVRDESMKFEVTMEFA